MTDSDSFSSFHIRNPRTVGNDLKTSIPNITMVKLQSRIPPGIRGKLDVEGPSVVLPQNPYNYQKPVSDKEMFFGQDEAMGELRKTVCNRRGSSASILYGPRRTGKSSLLRVLSQELESDSKSIPVYDDFDMIFDNLEKENWREVVQTLIGWVRMKGVSTIITTQRDLSQLVKHLSKKESANDSSTEFWNLLSPLCLDTLYLKPMPRDEMDAFKKIMEQDYQTQLDKPDVDEMYKLTGGHPELTQEAFSKLLERKCLHPDLSGQLVKSKKARRLTYDIVARQLQSGTQRLFLRYWNWDDLTEVHKQLLFTLATGRNLSLDEQSRIETSDLFNWGLITVAPDNDRYEIFSEAFKAFVNQRRREAFSDDPEKLYLTLELRLSKRQLQLFRLLYQNAGEELSEPELRKQIWEGKSLAENSRAVDLAIRRLKEKMKEVDPDQILGRIERLGGGSGYRFHKNNSGELPTP